MKKLFAGKYRIQSARLATWNYAAPGSYFITICTAAMHGGSTHGGSGRDAMHGVSTARPHYFGEIPLPPAGTILPDHLSPVGLMQLSTIGQVAHDEWFKTPAIRPDMNITLGEFVVMPDHVHGIITIGGGAGGRDATHGVSTFAPQSKNLASIIRGYKSAVTTFARKNNIPFNWQSRFYDRIIRTAEEYARISDYIRDNPLKWLMDRRAAMPGGSSGTAAMPGGSSGTDAMPGGSSGTDAMPGVST
ncbi:MAG: hypothetical protein JNM88_02830 [Chitinophagaceae bacterium]|nr:hypothetical protein [Chitinophagaceae bacterium]